jgi:hypothetical protein
MFEKKTYGHSLICFSIYLNAGKKMSPSRNHRRVVNGCDHMFRLTNRRILFRFPRM